MFYLHCKGKKFHSHECNFMNEAHQVYKLLGLLSFQTVPLSLNLFDVAGREERTSQVTHTRPTPLDTNTNTTI